MDYCIRELSGTSSVFQEHSHKSYRPLTTLTFRANYLLDGLRPFGYHVVNVALHAAVSVLFMRVCLMLVSTRTARVAALLFAVHPIHSEAVSVPAAESSPSYCDSIV